MLRERIRTAVVLLAVFAACLFVPSPWPLIVLLALACALACWEWLRMTASARIAAVAAAVLGVAALFGVTLLIFAYVAMLAELSLFDVQQGTHPVFNWMAVVFALLALACLIWLAVVPVMVVRARVDVPAKSVSLSAFAVLALATAWFALVTLFVTRGAWYLLSLLALVWVADVAAYFAGKRWGRRKLAARVSPGKSVEGALAGIAAGVVWMLVAAQFPGSISHRLLADGGLALTVLIAVLLVNASIIGDLFESLVKRRAGVKDSSSLLPGHGGVWDRIDAILPVAPLALLLLG